MRELKAVVAAGDGTQALDALGDVFLLTEKRLFLVITASTGSLGYVLVDGVDLFTVAQSCMLDGRGDHAKDVAFPAVAVPEHPFLSGLVEHGLPLELMRKQSSVTESVGSQALLDNYGFNRVWSYHAVTAVIFAPKNPTGCAQLPAWAARWTGRD